MNVTEDDFKRFFARIDYRPDGCWVFRSKSLSRRSAQFRLGDRVVAVRKVAYFIVRGEEPPAMLSTTCGNGRCVRPDHLRGGHGRKPGGGSWPRMWATFDGETRSLIDWSRDPRCPVTYATLRLRYLAGARDGDLLMPPPSYASPPKPMPAYVRALIRRLDRQGKGLNQINGRLRDIGRRAITAAELDDLSRHVVVPPGLADLLLYGDPRDQARRFRIPLSVVNRHRRGG